MLTILICVAIGVMLGALSGLGITESQNMSTDERTERIVGHGIGGAICAGFIGLMVALCASKSLPVKTTTKITSTIKLMAFNDGHRVQGSFFLGCGNINDVDYYLYYTIDPKDRAILQGKVRADKTRLYEQDREDGLLEVWTTEHVRGKSRWALSGPSWTETSYKIYVPRGTVLRRFVADLE